MPLMRAIYANLSPALKAGSSLPAVRLSSAPQQRDAKAPTTAGISFASKAKWPRSLGHITLGSKLCSHRLSPFGRHKRRGRNESLLISKHLNCREISLIFPAVAKRARVAKLVEQNGKGGKASCPAVATHYFSQAKLGGTRFWASGSSAAKSAVAHHSDSIPVEDLVNPSWNEEREPRMTFPTLRRNYSPLGQPMQSGKARLRSQCYRQSAIRREREAGSVGLGWGEFIELVTTTLRSDAVQVGANVARVNNLTSSSAALTPTAYSCKNIGELNDGNTSSSFNGRMAENGGAHDSLKRRRAKAGANVFNRQRLGFIHCEKPVQGAIPCCDHPFNSQAKLGSYLDL